jgi:hypothetical protein
MVFLLNAAIAPRAGWFGAVGQSPGLDARCPQSENRMGKKYRLDGKR